MDPMQPDMEQDSPGADEVIIQLLTELVQQGKQKRAESVISPPPPEQGEPPPPGEGDDQHMADLEAMLAEPGSEPPPEAPPSAPGVPPKKPDELE